MKRSTKRSPGPERIVTAAIEAFLDDGSRGRDGEAGDEHPRRRIGGGAVALGVLLGVGAHALYRRARHFDLERAARAVERRMVN